MNDYIVMPRCGCLEKAYCNFCYEEKEGSRLGAFFGSAWKSPLIEKRGYFFGFMPKLKKREDGNRPEEF